MNRKNWILMLLAVALVAGLVVPYCMADDDDDEPRKRIARRDRERDDDEPRRRRDDREHRERRERRREFVSRRPFPPEAERIEQMMNMLERMGDVCFDESAAGLIAIGGLKDDVRRKRSVIIADLEARLKLEVKTLGLRNAIRLSLKDLYKAEGNDRMVLSHLRAMLSENDKALQKETERDKE